jgi:hypothetical protein
MVEVVMFWRNMLPSCSAEIISKNWFKNNAILAGYFLGSLFDPEQRTVCSSETLVRFTKYKNSTVNKT